MSVPYSRRPLLALPLIALAGCLGSSSSAPDESTEDRNNSSDDTNGSSDDDGYDEPSYNEYLFMRMVTVDADVSDADCLSPDDERLEGVRLFELVFEELEETPPDEWAGDHPGAEHYTGTIGPNTPEGEESTAVYEELLEEATEDGRGVEHEVGGVSGTALCVTDDEYVVALEHQIEREGG